MYFYVYKKSYAASSGQHILTHLVSFGIEMNITIDKVF